MSVTGVLGRVYRVRSARLSRVASAIGDERGAIATEYAVVTAACAILIAGALAALGPPILASYQSSRSTLIAPEP